METKLFPNTPLFWALLKETRQLRQLGLMVDKAARIYLAGFRRGWVEHCMRTSGKELYPEYFVSYGRYA